MGQDHKSHGKMGPREAGHLGGEAAARNQHKGQFSDQGQKGGKSQRSTNDQSQNQGQNQNNVDEVDFGIVEETLDDIV